MLEQLSAGDRRKLIGILGRLGSDHPGERAAAGLLATRLLQSTGMSWEQVMGSSPPAPRLSTPTWRNEAEECLKQAGLLTDWEVKFLIDILARGALTTRQHEKVRQIAQQLRMRSAT